MSDMKPHLLPEWAPHAALWVGWPRLVEEWGGSLDGPRQDIARFIRAAAEFVPIRVAAGSDEAEATARAKDSIVALLQLVVATQEYQLA